MEDPFDTCFFQVGGSKEPNWFSSRHEKACICFSRKKKKRCIASAWVHSFGYTNKKNPPAKVIDHLIESPQNEAGFRHLINVDNSGSKRHFEGVNPRSMYLYTTREKRF